MRRVVLTLMLLLPAAPGWAIKEWYDYYADAQKAMERGRYKEALTSLADAVRLRSKSAIGEQTYGLDFVDYLPYYHQGICRLRLGEYAAALQLFNKEEEQGPIKKHSEYYGNLRKYRAEAQTKLREETDKADKERNARVAQEQVQRLRREATELHAAGKLDEALTQLASAQKAAELLAPDVRQQILDQAQKIRQEQAEMKEQADRAQRIAKGLEAGARLLEQDKAAEAKVQFEDVLAVDPQNPRAREGKRQAEETILAYTTHQERMKKLEEGKALFQAGEYEKALGPLTEAETDSDNAEAREYLQRVRKALEGVRKAKSLQLQIQTLLAEGEKLLSDQKYPEAMVKLVGVVELDPSNIQAQGRLALAERMTRFKVFELLFPNQEPVLTFLDLPATEIEAPTVSLVGLATDDRGLTRIEYRVDGRVVSERLLSPEGSGDFPRKYEVRYVFPLQAGNNQISVAAVDTTGVTNLVNFAIRRRLRFYETRAFWPSAFLSAVGLVGTGLLVQRARRRRAVRNRFNPYIAGAPVMDDDMFFGREKLLGRIMNVLHHNSLMITGERRIGKTTFLYHLKKALEADQGTEYRFFPVLTDLQGVPEESFFHALITDVVDELDLPPEVTASLRYRQEDESYDGRDFSHDLQRTIEHLKTRTDKRVKLALLIDEVDVLNDYSERINQRLRSIFMKTFSEHLVAIMSGVGIKRTWTSEGSPWYNFFDQIELSVFTREEAEALVREPVEGIFRFQSEAVEKILAMSQLKPYVIQKYCIHALNLMIEEGRTTVTARDVEAVRDVVHADGPEEEAPALERQVSA